MTIQEDAPLLVSVRQAAKMISCSEAFVRDEIKAGRLVARNMARRKTLVLVSSLREWVEGQAGK